MFIFDSNADDSHDCDYDHVLDHDYVHALVSKYVLASLNFVSEVDQWRWVFMFLLIKLIGLFVICFTNRAGTELKEKHKVSRKGRDE